MVHVHIVSTNLVGFKNFVGFEDAISITHSGIVVKCPTCANCGRNRPMVVDGLLYSSRRNPSRITSGLGSAYFYTMPGHDLIRVATGTFTYATRVVSSSIRKFLLKHRPRHGIAWIALPLMVVMGP